tara:strand:+ start:27088 stop:28503 length:1416 start_codon:yes stop_codon:yes gene_type:complete
MNPRTLATQFRMTAARTPIALLVIAGCCATSSARPILRIEPDETEHERIADELSDEEFANEGIRECIVTLLSGRKITGELVRQDSLIVVVAINDIETTFQRGRVAEVKLLPPIPQRYRELRAAINDDDIEARISLAEWLRTRRAYKLAQHELRAILVDAPTNARAKLLFNWLDEYNKLKPTTPQSDPTDTPAEPGEDPKDKIKTAPSTNNRDGRPPTPSSIPRLTPEQINLMRVYEIDLRNPPRLTVPDETLRALILRKPKAFSPNDDERQALYRLPEVEKLKILFTHKARDLYGQVIVHEDPESIKVFKQDIHDQHGWIMNSCATARCHGGADAGTFQLINTRTSSDASAYTNFYIIENYRLKDGSPLLDFEAPERSPLLQLGMVAHNALPPHPEIPQGYPGRGWKPIFRSTRDRKYRTALEWIRSLYQPRPVYDFQYPPAPEQNPSTKPKISPEAKPKSNPKTEPSPAP